MSRENLTFLECRESDFIFQIFVLPKVGDRVNTQNVTADEVIVTFETTTTNKNNSEHNINMKFTNSTIDIFQYIVSI